MDIVTARKKLSQFYILLVSAIVLTVIAVGTILAATLIEDSSYRELISISSATSGETRRQAYRQAITLCPDRAEAYLLLLETYGEDGMFSKSESEEFLGVYNAGHSRLTRDAAYGQIHTQAGLLYINAYDDTPTIRLRKALPFFDTAKQWGIDEENKTTVNCYANIGQYYREYIWAAGVKEVSPQEMEELLADINATLNAFASEAAADTVYNRLGFSTAVCNLFYDQRNILAATVPQADVLDILTRIYDDLPAENSLQVQQSMEMVRELNGNKEMYFDMIERAYERTGGI